MPSPRSGRQMKGRTQLRVPITNSSSISVASFAGSLKLLARYPRLGFAIAWGYHSLRLLRRLVKCFPLNIDLARRNLVRKQALANLLHGERTGGTGNFKLGLEATYLAAQAALTACR